MKKCFDGEQGRGEKGDGGAKEGDGMFSNLVRKDVLVSSEWRFVNTSRQTVANSPQKRAGPALRISCE